MSRRVSVLRCSTRYVPLERNSQPPLGEGAGGRLIVGLTTSSLRIASQLADLIERDAQHLGELESVNSGKGVRIARGKQQRHLFKTRSRFPRHATATVPPAALTALLFPLRDRL